LSPLLYNVWTESETSPFVSKSCGGKGQHGGPDAPALGATCPSPHATCVALVSLSALHLLPPARSSPTDMAAWLGPGPASSPQPSQGTTRQRLTLNTASRHDPDSGRRWLPSLPPLKAWPAPTAPQCSFHFPPLPSKLPLS